MIITSLLSVVLGYLLGSIPSAYIAGRLFKGIDMRNVGDGRIGAAYTYREVGHVAGAIVLVTDISKGMVAVLIADILGAQLAVVLLTGLAVIVGHNWSIFMEFKGGKGAATTYGVLSVLLLQELLVVFAIVAIPFLFIRKTGLFTGIIFALMTLVAWQSAKPALLICYPVTLSLPMFLKALFMPHSDTMPSDALKA